MFRNIKCFFNYLISGTIVHKDSRKIFGRNVYQKFKDIMVTPAAIPTGSDNYNDPVRKQLIEAKRKHAGQQKKDYSHVFT